MLDLPESRRGGYSHAGRGFLHDYDPPVPEGHAKQRGRPAAKHPPRLAARLASKHICVCAGPGGVGKTTVAAAIALGLARRGQRVAVVTIDPARRLAGALGLKELDNEPRRVPEALLAAHGVERSETGGTAASGGGHGELWAMMLDAKGTFDDLIAQLAPDERTREEVLSNRIYREISSAVAGTQEFSAIAKLYDLHREGGFDVIVLDTPPTHNAQDFLDAPIRLTRFFEGRALKLFLAPGGLAARVVGRGTGLVLSVFSRFTGVDLIADLSTFFGSLTGMVDGFRERARAVDELLHDPATAFLLVSTPEPEPAREAVRFARQLDGAGMSRAALIVNRVHRDGLEGHSSQEVRALLAGELGERLAGRVADNLADFDVLARRDRATLDRLTSALRDIDGDEDDDPILIPHLDTDVQDLAGLAEIERHLFG
jgi:anion-transporting  ArsA/GET3 family ATPase